MASPEHCARKLRPTIRYRSLSRFQSASSPHVIVLPRPPWARRGCSQIIPPAFVFPWSRLPTAPVRIKPDTLPGECPCGRLLSSAIPRTAGAVTVGPCPRQPHHNVYSSMRADSGSCSGHDPSCSSARGRHHEAPRRFPLAVRAASASSGDMLFWDCRLRWCILDLPIFRLPCTAVTCSRLQQAIDTTHVSSLGHCGLGSGILRS